MLEVARLWSDDDESFIPAYLTESKEKEEKEAPPAPAASDPGAAKA